MAKEKTIVIYHKDCIDGTAGAALFLKQFPESTFFPLGRGYKEEEFEELLKHIDTSSRIYIIDFSLSEKSHYEKLLNRARHITNIDHHISAQQTLQEIAHQYDTFELIFNTERSGATLAWEYLHGAEPVPEIFSIIEDGDTGTFAFGEKTTTTKAGLIQAANSPEAMLTFLEKPMNEISAHGQTISDFINFTLQKYQEKSEPVSLTIGEHIVYGYNATFTIMHMRSELGRRLAEKHRATVALFRINGNEVTFAFRGIDSAEPSARALAEKLGGGGHRNAAGARTTLSEFLNMCKKV